jgi:1-acyl-sn-glycerol-3-phosphate acyltransferase
MLYIILRLFFLAILKSLFRLQVYGRENIPKEGGFILASNHTSLLDPVILGVASQRRLNFMAKEELFHVPLLSWVISRVGAFPVKRQGADLSAVREALCRLKSAEGLVLFPGGSRSTKEVSYTSQPGVAFLALKGNIGIVPAFIKGAEDILPKGARFIRPGRLSVYFGRQIFIERRQAHNYQEIADYIMGRINSLPCE